MRLAILITIIEVFVTWASYGQTRFSVTGHIQDTASLPLKAVSIILLQVKDSIAVKTAMSDTSGSFSIDILLPGSYFIKISHVGFEEYTSAVFNIDNDRPVEVIKRITLRPASATLVGVTVSGKKKFIERQLDKTVVNVENSIIASTTTALELLQKIPGVTVDQNGNISLNGRSDVLVTINDRKNNLSVQQLAEMLRSISGDNIARIELVTNPSSKYDAQGSGGIINIKMKRSQKKA